MSSETTLFIGAHYEVTNPGSGQTVTKYYFAGASRIGMRKYTIPQSMAVEYMLGDHLGSTSITTDTTGAKVSEMRYKPWGEVRYSWTSGASTTPAYKLSSYTFTGQYSYMDDISTSGVTEGFGLMFYNARMYDPALGRFTSADSIIPGGVQGLDRYAYVNNSPLNYVDPSGHIGCDEDLKGHCINDDSGGNGGAPDSSGCGINGVGNFGFHCTEDDIRGARLDQRLAWFQWLRENMNQNIGSGAGDWFLNISTVVAGFTVTGQDSNQWVMDVDATILVSVQNGYVASLNQSEATGPASSWKTFFDNLGNENADPNQLIKDWGAAEQAATNFAISKWGDPTQGDDKFFTFMGNMYRGSGENICNWINSCIGTFFDPRATDAQVFGSSLGGPYNISPVAYLLGPVYFFDYLGISK